MFIDPLHEPKPAVQDTVVVESAPPPAPLPQGAPVDFGPHPEPNGIVDGDGDATMANGPTTHTNPEIPSPTGAVALARPRVRRKFYDIDLEKMHAKLYYEGFLTPSEFMEDLSRIVANAEVEPIDNERLWKAQAMFTAANLTILSWEPQLITECDRMAGREREREKERRRAERGKAKAVNGGSVAGEGEGEGVYAPGTRRSARNNGQEPEVPFNPDPERRLKRARSDGAGDSQEDPDHGPMKRARASGSEDEGVNASMNAHVEGGGTRMIPGVVVQEAEVNGGDTTLSTPFSQGFQSHVSWDISSPGHSQPSMVDQPRSVRFANELGFPEHDAMSLLNGLERSQNPHPMSLEYQLNTPMGAPAALNSISEEPPTLLSSHGPMYTPFADGSGLVNGGDPGTPNILPPQPSSSSFKELSIGSANDLPHLPALPIIPDALIPNPDHTSSLMAIDHPSPHLRTPSPTPPPPPPFQLSESLIDQLRNDLLDHTDRMDVEQLEQLRATLLNMVWNARGEWDRDGLVREMIREVELYARQIAEDQELGSP